MIHCCILYSDLLQGFRDVVNVINLVNLQSLRELVVSEIEKAVI